MVGNWKTITFTVDVEGGQTPFVIVQASTLEPVASALTVALGEEGDTNEDGPNTTDQLPVPINGVLPARTVEVTLHKLIVEPAFETVGF